ncbi:MAG TPA: DUF4349 domain-containing protein [Solirubrobacterales bacterium]|nr:DUF4349 domain-containing protein [Solirubrobacterales bacterium]
MRLRSDEPLDPGIEHELATIDRALAGRATDPGDADLAELAVLLRDERPGPDPGWVSRLDERAAAGFPRGGGGRGSKRSTRRAGGWMAPAGALATLLLVVVVVAVNQGGGSGGETASMEEPSEKAVTPDALEQIQADGADASSTYDAGSFSRLRDGSDKIAPGVENRKLDRDAQLSLSAQPDDVRDVTDEVISITRSLDGIVAASQVTETADGASSSLELTLPTRNLDTALDRMTDLADVDSLNETTTDITKPVVSAKDELRDAEARRRELLQALGNATTEAEADALELKIADARREIARAEAAYERLTAKARLSELAVTVSSNPGASDQRDLGDWLDDAVDVLRTVAGVLLVTLAIVVPIGLIVAIAAWVITRLRRRRREQALDG